MMLRTIHRWLAIISTVKSDISVFIAIYTYFTIITINNQDVQDPICGVAAAVKVNGILFSLHSLLPQNMYRYYNCQQPNINAQSKSQEGLKEKEIEI